MTQSALTFTRDRFTWLSYLMLAYYSYLQSSLGPLMTFLGAELQIDYSTQALHVTAFASGMITAGLTADRVMQRFGRRAIFWIASGGMTLGAVLLTLGRTAPVTIASSLLMGLIGSYLLVALQTALSDYHGERRATALTEANVAAAVSAALVPFVLSQTESLGLGWRAALLLGAAVWVLIILTSFRTPIPVETVRTKTDVDANGKLPRTFWLYWLALVFNVATEWCLGFWGADFLNRVVGLTRVDAAAAMSLFFVAMVFGRTIGSRLTRTVPASRLLFGAIVLALFAFPVLWLSTVPAMNLIGLFFAGLGVANLFPLTLAVASNVGSAQINKASARISLAGGIAIFSVPQLLGVVADQIGIQLAFGIAGIFILAALILIITANRSARLLMASPP